LSGAAIGDVPGADLHDRGGVRITSRRRNGSRSHLGIGSPKRGRRRGNGAAALRRARFDGDGSYRNPKTWRCSGTRMWEKTSGEEGCPRRAAAVETGNSGGAYRGGQKGDGGFELVVKAPLNRRATPSGENDGRGAGARVWRSAWQARARWLASAVGAPSRKNRSGGGRCPDSVCPSGRSEGAVVAGQRRGAATAGARGASTHERAAQRQRTRADRRPGRGLTRERMGGLSGPAARESCWRSQRRVRARLWIGGKDPLTSGPHRRGSRPTGGPQRRVRVRVRIQSGSGQVSGSGPQEKKGFRVFRK
jgi:hypothetical protein